MAALSLGSKGASSTVVFWSPPSGEGGASSGSPGGGVASVVWLWDVAMPGKAKTRAVVRQTSLSAQRETIFTPSRLGCDAYPASGPWAGSLATILEKLGATAALLSRFWGARRVRASQRATTRKRRNKRYGRKRYPKEYSGAEI